MDVVPLQGVRGEGDDQFWGIGRGAIAGCRFRVLGEGNDQFWGSGRGAISGCHIRALL